jgi:hypothetical protein
MLTIETSKRKSPMEMDIAILRTCRQPSRKKYILKTTHSHYMLVNNRLSCLIKNGLIVTEKIPRKHNGSILAVKPKHARGLLYISTKRGDTLLSMWRELETYYSQITSSDIKGEEKK